MLIDPTTLVGDESSAVTIERDVHRRGANAYAWLRQRGWKAEGELRSDAMIHADEMRTPSLIARRLRTSALTLHPIDVDTKQVLFLLQIEGSTSVLMRNGYVATVGPLGYLSSPLREIAAIRSHGPARRIDVLTDMPSIASPAVYIHNATPPGDARLDDAGEDPPPPPPPPPPRRGR